MKITLTLSEVLRKVNNWDDFCEQFGWGLYVVNEGGGHIEQTLTEEEAKKFGIL